MNTIRWVRVRAEGTCLPVPVETTCSFFKTKNTSIWNWTETCGLLPLTWHCWLVSGDSVIGLSANKALIYNISPMRTCQVEFLLHNKFITCSVVRHRVSILYQLAHGAWATPGVEGSCWSTRWGVWIQAERTADLQTIFLCLAFTCLDRQVA